MPAGPDTTTGSWIAVLRKLPYCARENSRSRRIGLVQSAPVHARWQDLEEGVQGDDDRSHLTRVRALWSRVRHGHVQSEIGETGCEHLGPVEGVHAVVTGHTPVPEPVWHENVLGGDTGVHIDERWYGRRTIARIDTRELRTLSFDRAADDANMG